MGREGARRRAHNAHGQVQSALLVNDCASLVLRSSLPARSCLLGTVAACIIKLMGACYGMVRAWLCWRRYPYAHALALGLQPPGAQRRDAAGFPLHGGGGGGDGGAGSAALGLASVKGLRCLPFFYVTGTATIYLPALLALLEAHPDVVATTTVTTASDSSTVAMGGGLEKGSPVDRPEKADRAGSGAGGGSAATMGAGVDVDDEDGRSVGGGDWWVTGSFAGGGASARASSSSSGSVFSGDGGGGSGGGGSGGGAWGAHNASVNVAVAPLAAFVSRRRFVDASKAVQVRYFANIPKAQLVGNKKQRFPQ